jgi:DnaJ-class molecular chaperone
MGLHLCPIEPDDWSNGPVDEPEGEDCGYCNGTGMISDEREDIEHTCQECGGSGVKEVPEHDEDWYV